MSDSFKNPAPDPIQSLHFYNSSVDIIDIIHRYADNSESSPFHFTNYFGVKIDPKIFPAIGHLAGHVEGPPIPGNWHADMAEFGAVLRAVDLASDSFRVVELGCGWGCWLLISGRAARRRGLNTFLIGAEGDKLHVSFARQACVDNGFFNNATIHQAAFGPTQGTAIFPLQEAADNHWGLSPIFNATTEDITKAEASGLYQILPIMTLGDLVSKGERIDLLHMDIQGGEADFIEKCGEEISGLVSYMVIGTHSRQIEGRVFSALLAMGWILEVERPCILRLQDETPTVSIDGVQGWRNPRLLPSRLPA